MTGKYDALLRWFNSHSINTTVIKLRGHSGGNTDYQAAKRPTEKGWPQSHGLTGEVIATWLACGGWIGLIVPGGYIVIDVDDKRVFQHLTERLKSCGFKCIAIQTPNGGQFFFKDTGLVMKQRVKTITAGGVVVDYRLAGKGQIVCPTDNTGGRFILHMDDALDDMPLFFISVMPYDPKKHEDKLLPVPILEGSRDDTLFRHAGRLREWNTKYSLKLTPDQLKEVLHEANDFLCEPCLDEHVVDEKVKAALAYPVSSEHQEEKEKRPTQAELLIEIGERPTSFHDDTGDAYTEIAGHNVKMRSSAFKQHLARQLWLQEKKAPNSDAMNQALCVLEAKAIFEGKQRTLYNRVALHAGSILYDLGDGRAVQVIPGQWSIVSDPPMIFKRYSHQQIQVEPKGGGNLRNIFKYLNIIDEEHQLLAMVLLVAYFIPEIAHPIMHPHGDQGSGKTTLSVFFKALIDPSKLSVFFAPSNLGETVQTLEHHYFICFDNLSDIQNWLSDLLAQVVTGAGLSKRKLYTDDEDVIYQLRRCVAVNGINQLIHRPDAMDRSILLHHARIDASERKSERALISEFENEKPYLLGSIFDALSTAMTVFSTISLPELPRMADFALWGCAIAQALGYRQDDFTQAYRNNIKGQNNEIVGGNTLAQALLSFMHDKTEWTGTVRDAFQKLLEIANPRKEDRTFPKAPNKLRRNLERIRPNLLEYGVKFEIADYGTVTGIPICFQNIGKVSSGHSDVHESNNTNGLKREHTLNIVEGQKVPSGDNGYKDQHLEDAEHTEDKKVPFWESTEDDVFVPEFDIPGAFARSDLGGGEG